MRLINYFKYVVVLGILLTMIPEANAQSLLMDMDCSVKQGTWQSISGEIVAQPSDDDRDNIDLPFPFWYDGYEHTQAEICANGWFGFRPNLAYGSLTPSNITSHRPVVHWMARDGFLRGTAEFRLEGSAPNRVAIYQFNRYDITYSSGTVCDVTCQVRLYESGYKIEIIYGPITNQSENLSTSTSAVMGFSGRTAGSYWNVDPLTSGPNNWVIYNPIDNANTARLLNSNAKFESIPEGATILLGSSEPKLTGAVPTHGSSWGLQTIYDAPADHPAVFMVRTADMPTVNVELTIYPKGDPDGYIYRGWGNGVTAAGPDDQTEVRYNFTQSEGVAAGANDQLDLFTNYHDILPGEYVVKAVMTMNDDPDFLQEISNQIILPVKNDMCVYKIIDPLTPDKKIYATDGVPVEVMVRNQGENSRPNWKLNVWLYNEDHEMVDEFEFNYPEDDPGDGHALVTAETYTVNFGDYIPDAVGGYYVKAEVTFEGADDELVLNNSVPTTQEDEWSYEFEIAHNYDLRVVRMNKPMADEEIYVGRPIKPEVAFTNLGINDASTNVIDIVIYYDGDTVYTSQLENEPIYEHDTTIVRFMDDFVPQYTGEYQACFSIYSEDDQTEGFEDMCETFYAVAALSGDYTIGFLNEYEEDGETINQRNFCTINHAIDALYLRGVSAPVVFEFTDLYYEVGDIYDLKSPALDLTSRITGVNAENTITFKACNDRAIERAGEHTGVTIKLNAGSGVGILIGQNAFPRNQYAVAFHDPDPKYRLSDDLLPEYVNSAGYFIFDGGNNKSIRFQIETPTDEIENRVFQAPFYLEGSASNITIQNCQFENIMSENEVPHAWLPRTRRQNNTRVYAGDKETQGTSYSAAIVMRSKVPAYEGGLNTLNFDTLTCDNNTIKGNEISGFGYGVVAMGSGPLLQAHSGAYKRFYNKNNVIENNIITEVSRAGIFLGYEEYSTVRNNKIYNVNGNYQLSSFTAGILAGDFSLPGWQGFNNIGLTIENNEISLVEYQNDNAGAAAGILIIQGQNEMTNPSSGYTYFPNAPESFMIRNNIIWGVNITRDDQSRYGLALMTEPVEDGYRSRNDKIVNNTIILDDDGFLTRGQLIGVALQRTDNTQLLNNAIAVMDEEIFDDPDGNGINSLVFYEGVMPGTENGLVSNRNAFWKSFKTDLLDRSGVSIYAFQETDRYGETVPYHKDDYETLRQWRNWTNQDYNSVIGNFLNDYSFDTDKESRNLRVRAPYPKGSILNNRGFRLTEMLDKDIEDVDRGVAGVLYDIGACEFDGAVYLQDLELKTVSEPSTYQSGAGRFADAEYVMTTLPVDYKAIIRNSGSLDQSQVEVLLKIYRETSSGVFPDEPIEEVTIYVDVVTAQSIEASFNLPEVEAARHDTDKIFLTYAQLREKDPDFIVPEWFDELMLANVTPRFKYSVEIRPDENNDNNKMDIITRYYIKRSNVLSTCVSTEMAWKNIYTTTFDVNDKDAIAGRLNYEKLQYGFEKLNFFTEIDKDRLHPEDDDIADSLKLDIFDRDGWEPRSVDYSMYKYLWWSDVDDNEMLRYQRWDIQDFLNEGVDGNKKNIIIGSQEMVRENINITVEDGQEVASNTDYVSGVLRADYLSLGVGVTSTPWAAGTKNRYACGVSVGRDIMAQVVETNYDYPPGDGIVDDVPPMCGLMTLNSEGDGQVREAFYWCQDQNGTRTAKDSIMGVTHVSLTRNVVLLGVDWRHWSDVEGMIRLCIDFTDKNGGPSIPVELASFNAQAIGNRVDLSWKTYSELNSDRFEVQRADMNNGIKGTFDYITDVKAAGTSSYELDYSTVDNNVQLGAKYIYRLKMIDLDGSSLFSDEKMVEIGNDGSFYLGNAAPNPATDNNVSFDLAMVAGADIDVVLYDINGNKTATSFDISDNKLVVNLSNVANGAYTMVVNSNGYTMTRQIRVSK